MTWLVVVWQAIQEHGKLLATVELFMPRRLAFREPRQIRSLALRHALPACQLFACPVFGGVRPN
jgi:hypothetical protein